MILEDQVIGESPAIKISIRTFDAYDADYRKMVWLDSPEDVLGYTEIDFGSKRADFIKRLKRGDQLLIVESGGKVKLAYGPLNEENLYIQKE